MSASANGNYLLLRVRSTIYRPSGPPLRLGRNQTSEQARGGPTFSISLLAACSACMAWAAARWGSIGALLGANIPGINLESIGEDP